MPRRDDEDDYEYRPRRRRPRDDDDEEDDGPRRGGSRRGDSGGGTKTVLIVLGVLGAVFLVCAGVAAVVITRQVKKVQELAQREQEQDEASEAAFEFGNALDEQQTAGGWTAPFATDSHGDLNPRLSFRVELLPHLGQQALYGRIDRDQPWDAERNRAACATDVAAFKGPGGATPAGQTPYRVFVGGGALFELDGRRIRLADIPDGASNTFLFAEAAETVPWAQPRELMYSKTAPLPALGPAGGGKNPRGFLVGLADGSVHTVRRDASESALRRFIEKADGLATDDDILE